MLQTQQRTCHKVIKKTDRQLKLHRVECQDIVQVWTGPAASSEGWLGPAFAVAHDGQFREVANGTL
jgi:hypothetical protein